MVTYWTLVISRYLHYLLLFFGLAGFTSRAAIEKRFTTEQYLALPALAIGSLVLLSTPPPTEARWKGGILFDESIRDSLRLTSKGGRDAAALVGDIMLTGLVVYPILIDSVWDRWIGHDDGDSARQLSLIATQAFLFSTFLRLVSKVAIGRERPFERECSADPTYDTECGQQSSRASFFSGHATTSFTGAGLICAAHESLALHGGMTPCYLALGVATGVSISRVMADRHHLTDTLFGAAVGLFSGYVLPRWLNFSTQAMISPVSDNGGIGFRYATAF